MKSRYFFFLFVAFAIFGIYPHAAFAVITDTQAESTAAAKEQCLEYQCLCDGVQKSTAAESGDACLFLCSAEGSTAYELDCTTRGYGVARQAGANIDYTSDLTAAPGTEKSEPVIPVLNVSIPGLDDFSTPTTNSAGDTQVNFLGEYVAAVYAWLIGAASVVAIVMIMIGGLQYMLARGDAGKITKAKERMGHAVVGMVLLLLAYDIAYLISPSLVTFKSLSVPFVQGQESFPSDGEDTASWQNDSTVSTEGSVPVSGNHISAAFTTDDSLLNSAALVALQKAADAFYSSTAKNIRVTSAGRTMKHQASLFYNNCLLTGGVCKPITCDVTGSKRVSTDVLSYSSGKYSLTGDLAGSTNATTIINALAAAGKAGYCPHTSMIAVDVWCDDGGNNWQHNVQCQLELTQAMVDAGFCRITAEPWHFELNSAHKSSSCSQSVTSAYTNRSGSFNPGNTCKIWDYKYNSCITKNK